MNNKFEVVYCGTFTGGCIRMYTQLDRATAGSIFRHFNKLEKRVDKDFRGIQILSLVEVA